MNFQALPHSEESERAVLAGVLMSPSLMPSVAQRLELADFYLDKHQAIYDAMRTLDLGFRPIDLRTLQARLELTNSFELIGGLAYLTGLDLMLPDLGRILEYVEVVKECAVRRGLMQMAANVTASCLAGGIEAPLICGEALADLNRLAGAADRHEPRQIYEPAMEMVAELRENAQKRNPFSGYFTGLPAVDSAIVGLELETLSLWIANPGAGKTAWALQVAESVNAAGGRVFFASLEMSEKALVRRLACRALKIPVGAIARGEVSDWQLDQIDAFAVGLKERDFLVDDSTTSALQVCARIRSLHARGRGPHLCVFDYLQLADPPDSGRRSDDPDWKSNGANCKIMRKTAVEVGAHFMVLGQANEDGKLRGGGGWQEADLMVRIERPWEKTRDPMASPEDRAAVNLALLKNRLGTIGDVSIEFDGDRQAFRELAEGSQEQGRIF